MKNLENVASLIGEFAMSNEQIGKKEALELINTVSNIDSVVSYVDAYYKEEDSESITDNLTNRQMVIAYRDAWKRASQASKGDENNKYKAHHVVIKKEIESYFVDTLLDVMAAKYKTFTQFQEQKAQEDAAAQAKAEKIAELKNAKRNAKRRATELTKKAANETNAVEKANLYTEAEELRKKAKSLDDAIKQLEN